MASSPELRNATLAKVTACLDGIEDESPYNSVHPDGNFTYPLLIKSEATIADALQLLKRTLRRAGLKTGSFMLVISDETAFKKIEKVLPDVCADERSQQFRYIGISITCPPLSSEKP
jgi:hypothetical protein